MIVQYSNLKIESEYYPKYFIILHYWKSINENIEGTSKIRNGCTMYNGSLFQLDNSSKPILWHEIK